MSAPQLSVSRDVMSLENKFCRINFFAKLKTPGGRVPRESHIFTFMSQRTKLADRGYTQFRSPCRGTIGETRGGLTTFKQPLVFSVEDAVRLEESFGGCLSDGPFPSHTFRADFQRVGGPSSVSCLVVDVPDHFPAAEVLRLLSALPGVVSVALQPAIDRFGMLRTACMAVFRATRNLPREVHLFAPDGTPLRSLDGRLCKPLRLEVQRESVTICPMPGVQPIDKVLPRSALSTRSVWGQAHKQQQPQQPQQPQ